MSSVYQSRRPRASPLWQIVHHGWDDFLAGYEQNHRKTLGPLRAGSIATIEAFLRCGDLASGFTRFHCPDCGHEKLLAFTCKGRHFCPACHQRRVRTVGAWIATSICHEVPHRQFVFTIPKVLRGIFRKRRHLLTHLFHTAISTLQGAFRIRLDLPDGRIGAVAAVHTFGDYLIFHPRHHLPLTLKPWSPSSHLGKPSKNGFLMTNRISTGLTKKGNQPAMIPAGMTKAPLGNLRKYRSAMVSSWFLKMPD